ncbi:MerR family transcriptional regulator [Microtetraspora niveoalba]|uniref:MerR family transcriptional regulator n=1 Tax=Microtetraspora niveoalba TaxID=46175 RepID=UPI000B0D8FDD|nr:MerR family transcriptional regulator [Microtetraspora niveoalba]
MARRALRPADLAGEHGLSAQAVRNYEDEGIIPPAARSPAGYRQYSAVHAQALRAFLALRPGYGHQPAAAIMRAAHRPDEETLFRLLDLAHAELLRERDILDEVAAALDALTAAPVRDDDRTAGVSIGVLAHRLGMHPASLRKWEQAGILRPHRDRATGHRVYPPEAVRDAQMARHLRRGGYPLPQIRLFVEHLRDAGGTADLGKVLHEWRARLHRRSRAMLAAARHLDEYLDLVASTRPE